MTLPADRTTRFALVLALGAIGGGFGGALEPTAIAWGQERPVQRDEDAARERLEALGDRQRRAGSADAGSSGGADIDDLLDIGSSLEQARGRSARADAARSDAPPPRQRSEIERAALQLKVAADAVQRELFEELPALARSNPAAAGAEIIRREREVEDRLSSLEDRLDQVGAAFESGVSTPADRGQARGGPGGYGDPIRLGGGQRAGAGDSPRGARGGQEQFAWWQRLAVNAAKGIDAPLTALAEKRLNALKSEADALALATEPRYRPFVDGAVRQAIGDSSLGQGGDARLSDLFLAGRPTQPTRPPAARPAAPNFDALLDGPNVPIQLLPRIIDPITGKERIVIDYPLGEGAGSR